MPNPTTVRERRLRKTKSQLIDEIDTLEQRVAAIEAAHRSDAPLPAMASDRYLANQEITDLARFPSENPNPVLRVMPDGTVLYANEAARAANGLLKSMLAGDLAGVCAEASRTAEVRETEFESGDRVFAFSIEAVADETYTRRHRCNRDELAAVGFPAFATPSFIYCQRRFSPTLDPRTGLVGVADPAWAVMLSDTDRFRYHFQ